MDMNVPPRHQTTRVRRETRRRSLTVAHTERLTPGMQRVRFTSPDLHDFESGSPDDHVKVFLPAPDGRGGGPGGAFMRDYTPRAFDATAQTLTLDFAVHDAGPATAWALSAQVGDSLSVGGPRGSAILADDFDWYLLVGDETALPAMGRRVEELRPGVAVTTVAVLESDADRQVFDTQAAWTSVWIARQGQALDDTALFRRALDALPLPRGDGYVWIAAEGRVAKALRAYMIETRNHPREWIKAAGYWSRGEAGAHETFQD